MRAPALNQPGSPFSCWEEAAAVRWSEEGERGGPCPPLRLQGQLCGGQPP